MHCCMYYLDLHVHVLHNTQLLTANSYIFPSCTCTCRALCLECGMVWVRIPPKAAHFSLAVLYWFAFCLFDLACFFLPSFLLHLSNMYILYLCTCTGFHSDLSFQLEVNARCANRSLYSVHDGHLTLKGVNRPTEKVMLGAA